MESIRRMLTQSGITTIGIDYKSDLLASSLFDCVSHLNDMNVVRFNLSSSRVYTDTYSSFMVTSLEEAFEYISTLTDKTIIIDNLYDLVMSNVGGVVKFKSLYTKYVRLIMGYSISNDCNFIIGTPLQSDSLVSSNIIGSSELLYASSNVFYLIYNEINCIKSRNHGSSYYNLGGVGKKLLRSLRLDSILEDIKKPL